MKINIKCKTCEWAFPEYKAEAKSYDKRNIEYYICAGHSDLVEYGSPIKDLDFSCDSWEIEMNYFSKIRDKLKKSENVALIEKVENKLGINFQLLKKVRNNKFIFRPIG